MTGHVTTVHRVARAGEDLFAYWTCRCGAASLPFDAWRAAEEDAHAHEDDPTKGNTR